jgi:putative two-component system response regulator
MDFEYILMNEVKMLSAGNDSGISRLLRYMLPRLHKKDSYTGLHSYRVSNYAMILAKEVVKKYSDLYNITGVFVPILNIEGLFHDIGKLGIDDGILKKQSFLTEEEFIDIKKHPKIGKDRLNRSAKRHEYNTSFSQIEKLLPGVLYHHEHCDGSGYPKGLTKDEIPLDARVIAIVDSFDAMTTDRPYRKAYSFDDAIDRLYEKRQWYDNLLLKCFNESINEIRDFYDKFGQKVNGHELKKVNDFQIAANFS